MHSKSPPRNRLAKVLPERFRVQLQEAGLPKRKYAAVLRATLVTGEVIEEMVVEEGWIVGLTREALTGHAERRIELDVRLIERVEILESI